MCLDDQLCPKVSKRNQILMPICLKTDGQDFSMGKEHQGEMPHVRRRYFKLNLQQAETIEKNKLAFRRFWGEHWEGPQNSVLRKIVLSHWPLSSKVHLLWNASICCWKRAPSDASSSAKKISVFMNSVWDQICHHLCSVLQKGEFFSCLYWNRACFHTTWCQCLPF